MQSQLTKKKVENTYKRLRWFNGYDAGLSLQKS